MPPRRTKLLILIAVVILSNIHSSFTIAGGLSPDLPTTNTGIPLINAAPPTVTVTILHEADCKGDGAYAIANGSGGAGSPYAYSLDGSTWQPNNFLYLPVGISTIYVRDASLTVATTSVTVAKHCLTATAAVTPTSCTTDDGVIHVNIVDGIGPYYYSIDGGFQWRPDDPDFIGLAPGSYDVYVLDDAGQLTSILGVTVARSCLQVTATPTDATCGLNNGSIKVVPAFGQGPYLYSLDGTNFQANSQFTGLAPSNYTVTVKDNVGAIATVAATINAVNPPTMILTPSNATCANNDGKIVVQVSDGTQPYQYAIDNGAFGSNPTFSGLATGSHLIAVKDANGCGLSQSDIVGLTNDLTISVPTADIHICEGGSTVIPATSNGSAANGTAFTWSPATELDNDHTLKPKVTPTANRQYTLQATRGACQQTSPAVNIIIDAAPVAAIDPVSTICYGQSTQLQGSGGVKYSWSPSTYLSDPTSASPTVGKPAQSMTYQLTVEGANGCKSLQLAVIDVIVTPPPKVAVGADTAVKAGQPVPLHATDISGSGLNHWNWAPVDELDNPYIQNPVARPSQTTVYTVLGSTDAGCEATASMTVRVFTVSDILVPSAFTPNNDGHNELLRALPISIKEFRYFQVFNRFGQRVFYTTNAAEGWHGSSNGNPAPAGTYIWMAAGVDQDGTLVQRKGTVLLIR